jgi:putative endonuclease
MFYPKKNKTQKRKTGDLGEKLSRRFLVEHGFTIIERNYLKSFGEIDIIAKNKRILHFVEVKTVSRGTNTDISRETLLFEASEHIDAGKISRLKKTIDVYMKEKNVPHETVFQIDALLVILDQTKKIAEIEMIENIF